MTNHVSTPNGPVAPAKRWCWLWLSARAMLAAALLPTYPAKPCKRPFGSTFTVAPGSSGFNHGPANTTSLEGDAFVPPAEGKRKVLTEMKVFQSLVKENRQRSP